MSIGDIVYGLSWYQLSRNDQYIVKTIIRRAQKPIALKGLGVFVCSLNTFLNVTMDHILTILPLNVAFILTFFR